MDDASHLAFTSSGIMFASPLSWNLIILAAGAAGTGTMERFFGRLRRRNWRWRDSLAKKRGVTERTEGSTQKTNSNKGTSEEIVGMGGEAGRTASVR